MTAKRRKRQGPAKGQGGGGQRNPRSLANLRPITVADGAAGIGNTRAMTHGGRSEALVRDVSDEVRELMDALGEGAPVREADGTVPAADTAALEIAARCLKRYRAVSTWLDLYGRLDEKTGEPKNAAHFELRCESALARALDVLGCSPMARSRLGLNIARTAGAFDLARHWQEQGGDDGA
jgi:hypothetical protein